MTIATKQKQIQQKLLKWEGCISFNNKLLKLLGPRTINKLDFLNERKDLEKLSNFDMYFSVGWYLSSKILKYAEFAISDHFVCIIQKF